MRTENSGGDVLARGGVKATFQTAGSKVTQEQWDSIFGGKDEPEVAEVGSGGSNVSSAGDVSFDVGKDFPDDSGC